jgi:membrane-associated protease RseP (regulator of RpoE activity)
MKSQKLAIGVLALLGILCGPQRFASAQNNPGGSELQLHNPTGSGAEAIPPGGAPRARGYLGAMVDDKADRGRGVRVLNVHPGGPAEQAGLQTNDLIVGAGGASVRQLSDLTAVMDLLGPGDKLSLEVVRGNRPARGEVILGQQGAATEQAPSTSPQPTSSLPPVPSESTSGVPRPLTPPGEGPSLMPGADAARIDQLERRIAQLEQRVEELERKAAGAGR